ncbi:MAG TPA: tetratricopeptide repeat protein [Kiritimatiellia bacterium]|nr:tetratricopeptide repeat protein [Kiritimatiellia bacterium]
MKNMRALCGGGMLMIVLATSGCQVARPGVAPASGAGEPTVEQLVSQFDKAYAEQVRIDKEINKLRDDLYRTALALKTIRDRLEGWAVVSTANVARLVVLEEQLREARIRAGDAAAAETGALRASLEREREHQERLRALVAEREKEVRDLREANRAQQDALRRLPAPAPAPAPASAPTPALAPQPAPVPAPAPAAKAAEDDSTSVFRMVAEGQRALKAGDLARAKERFDAARARDPNLAGALMGLAAIAYQIDDLKEARRLVDDVLAKDARNAQALGLRGLIRWREGFVRDGVRDCERAVELDPNDPLLRKFLGITLNARGRTEDAIREMRKAVELDPSDAEAKLNLAILLATGAKPDVAAARGFYEQALKDGAAPDPALERLLKAQSP